MKKTLIALAVLAASSASFAQVTITGEVQMGYQALHTVSGGAMGAVPNFAAPPYLGIYNGSSVQNDQGGLGIDTANLYFTVTEDLGGGQKVVAKEGFDTISRGGVVGGDTVLTYTNNSFGQIEIGSAKAGDVFTEIAYTDGNLITFDGRLNQIETSNDYISYAAPIGPLLFEFRHNENGNSVVAGGPNGGLGLGVGGQGPASITTQGDNTLVLAYLKSPLQVVGAYRAYMNQDNVGGVFDGNGLTKKDAIHVEAGYDFGVVKVGLGLDHVDASWGFSQDSAMLGLSVPAGSWQFSGAFEMVTDHANPLPIGAVANPPGTLAVLNGIVPGSGTALAQASMQNADGTANGITLGATYNFSKSTNFAVKYSSWTRSGYEQFEAFGITQNLNEFGYKSHATDTRVELTKNF